MALYDELRLRHFREAFGPSLQLVADALSPPLDTIEASGEVNSALAKKFPSHTGFRHRKYIY
jgi:hypothetical protein